MSFLEYLKESRKLNFQQMAALTKLYNNSGIQDIDDAPANVADSIEALNSYETFWSDANRFLGDLATKKVIASRGKFESTVIKKDLKV